MANRKNFVRGWSVRGWLLPTLLFSLVLGLLSLSSNATAGEKKPDNNEARAVARELHKLQQQMGGSIVADSEILKPEPPSQLSAPQQQVDLVRVLRTAAWQLDRAANELERANLYRQADALRKQAQSLRLDARLLVAGADSNQSAVSRLKF